LSFQYPCFGNKSCYKFSTLYFGGKIIRLPFANTSNWSNNSKSFQTKSTGSTISAWCKRQRMIWRVQSYFCGEDFRVEEVSVSPTSFLEAIFHSHHISFEDVAKISTNKFSTSLWFFSTFISPHASILTKQGHLQVIFHFELT